MNRPLHQYPEVGVVIAAGGSATRFGGTTNKLLRNLDGIPLIAHCLRTFLTVLPADQMVVVIPPGQGAEFHGALRAGGLDPKAIRCVGGGERRQDSVGNGLRALPSPLTIVAVQDAARPYSSQSLIKDCLESARRHGSGVAARRVVDTIKVADSAGRVQRTLDRNLLWATETPQVFRRELLEAAYRQANAQGLAVTDEAQAVEILGQPVHLVEHREPNPKITFASDLSPSARQRPWARI